MRRLLLMLTVATVALVAAACSSASTPGWTYAPPTPSPTPGASVAASGAAPSAGASAEAPSAGASAEAPSAGASEAPSGGAAGGDVVNISAMGIQFEQSQVTAPAGKPFVIRFDNKEAVPHNVDIKDASGTDVFKGDIVTGPAQVDYNIPALAAGTYTFSCIVHPNMTGTLTAS